MSRYFFPELQEVQALAPYRLRTRWSTGKTLEVDIADKVSDGCGSAARFGGNAAFISVVRPLFPLGVRPGIASVPARAPGGATLRATDLGEGRRLRALGFGE